MKWFSKIDEGEQRPENQKKSNCLISQISKLASYFIKKFKIFRFSKHGAILIEFAVCIPILIIAMLYIHDIVKIRRYYSQTEFAGQQMINIIQNISQKRTDKQFTLSDIRLALYLASLSFYPGKFASRGSDYYDKQIPCVAVNVVEGINGKATIRNFGVAIAYYDQSSGYNQNRPFGFVKRPNDASYSIIHPMYRWRELETTDIWPSLKIQNGEKKAIIETFITMESRSNTEPKIDLKKIFGLFLLNPKILRSCDNTYIFFHSALIFKLGNYSYQGGIPWGWDIYTPYSWYDDYNNWSYEDRLDFEKTDEWIQFIQSL